MLADDSADYAKVFRRYVPSDDIANRVKQSPGRWIIDFAQIGLAGATKFARALASARDCSRSSQAIARQESRRRVAVNWVVVRAAARRASNGSCIAESLHRCPAGRRVGKQVVFGWQSTTTNPADATNAPPSTAASPTSQPCTKSSTWRWRWPWRWPRPAAGRPPRRRTPPSSSRPNAHNLIVTAPGGCSFRRRSDSSGKPVAFRPAAQSRTLNPPRPVPAKPPRAELSASGMRGVNDDLRVAEA